MKDWVAKEQENSYQFTLDYLAGQQAAAKEKNERLGDYMPGEKYWPYTQEAEVKEYNPGSIGYKLGYYSGLSQELGDIIKEGMGYNAAYKVPKVSGSKVEGSSKAELNVPGTKYYNPNYKTNMSMEDMIWGVKDSGKGLSTMGSSSRANAWEAGKSWVGPDAKAIMQNGEVIGYSSKDGMRSFRLQYKANEGRYRANFQENVLRENPDYTKKYEVKNVHVDILD